MLPIDGFQDDCAPATINPGHPCFGGMARRFTFVQQNRQNYTNTLAVDVGNLFYGQWRQCEERAACSATSSHTTLGVLKQAQA